MKRTIAIPALIAAASLAGACGSQGYSSLNGSTSDDISRYEKDHDKTLSPRYAALYEGEGQAKAVNVGIFFSYDRFHAFAGAGRDAYRPSNAAQSDLAYQAFDRIKAWFAGRPGDAGFLQRDVTVNGVPLAEAASAQPERHGSATYVWRLSGMGPSLAIDAQGKPEAALRWNVTLTVGDAYDFAADVGRSMAENNITVLNGHFYLDDARAGESAAPADAFAEATRPAFDGRAFPPAPQRDRIRSQIYEPAFDAFARAEPSHKKPYRMIVFNGCFSEEIENLAVPRLAKQGLADAYDLVGMRGFSNYRYFGPQMSGFFRTLAGQGKWTDLLANFRIAKSELPVPRGLDALQPTPSQGDDRVTPVLRNSSLNQAPYTNKVIP